MQAILPGLTTEQATLAAQLATVAVSAAVWPNTIPSPVPAPMYEVLLSASVRFGQAILQGSTLPVVSESLGSYSYRLATPATLTGAFGLTSSELAGLAPWIERGTSYDVSVSGGGNGATAQPVDWWQRDYDSMEGVPMAEIPEYYLTEAEGDARYSRLGHAHARIAQSTWNFATSTVDGDPGDGRVRLDTTDPALATWIYLDPIDANGSDWGAILGEGQAGGDIRLQDRDDSTRWVRYDVTGATVSATGYLRIPVAFASASGTLVLTNNMALLVYFAQPGHP